MGRTVNSPRLECNSIYLYTWALQVYAVSVGSVECSISVASRTRPAGKEERTRRRRRGSVFFFSFPTPVFSRRRKSIKTSRARTRRGWRWGEGGEKGGGGRGKGWKRRDGGSQRGVRTESGEFSWRPRSANERGAGRGGRTTPATINSGRTVLRGVRSGRVMCARERADGGGKLLWKAVTPCGTRT